jgi:hypothetical protein
MRFSFARWRAPHLLGAWVAYWVGLGAVTLGPYVAQIRRVTSAPDNTGSISLSTEDAELTLRIIENGRTVADASMSILSIALLVAGPPLLLWLLWLAVRSRGEARAPGAIGAGPMHEVRMEEQERAPGSRRPR